MPVWVRIDEYAGLLELFRSKGFTFPQIRDYLAGVVQRAMVLMPLPNLAGVIISSGLVFPNNIPPNSNSLVEPSDYNGSISISCYKLIQRVRHTFIIPRIIPSNDVEIFPDFYAHEDTWLDWALEEMKFPPFKDLVRVSPRIIRKYTIGGFISSFILSQ